MTQEKIIGVLLEDAALNVDEFARACAVEPQWVIERIESGILGDGSVYLSSWRFTSNDLRRARRIRQLECDFEAAPELAALCVDLFEEIEQLKRRIAK